jgi:hypothetical protein
MPKTARSRPASGPPNILALDSASEWFRRTDLRALQSDSPPRAGTRLGCSGREVSRPARPRIGDRGHRGQARPGAADPASRSRSAGRWKSRELSLRPIIPNVPMYRPPWSRSPYHSATKTEEQKPCAIDHGCPFPGPQLSQRQKRRTTASSSPPSAAWWRLGHPSSKERPLLFHEIPRRQVVELCRKSDVQECHRHHARRKPSSPPKMSLDLDRHLAMQGGGVDDSRGRVGCQGGRARREPRRGRLAASTTATSTAHAATNGPSVINTPDEPGQFTTAPAERYK